MIQVSRMTINEKVTDSSSKKLLLLNKKHPYCPLHLTNKSLKGNIENSHQAHEIINWGVEKKIGPSGYSIGRGK